MPDPLPRQSALAKAPQPDDLIQERTGLWIQRLYAPDRQPGFGDKIGLDLPETANRATFTGDLQALWVAPGEWFLVGAEAAGWHDIVTRVAETGGALSELSHARTVFRIAAGPAQDILAKDCPLDLRPASFAPGYCAQSILAGVGMLVHYLADGRHIDIYVARSYGQFIHAWLQDAALSL